MRNLHVHITAKLKAYWLFAYTIICVKDSWSHCLCQWVHIWHMYWHTSSTNIRWVIWVYCIQNVFQGHICCWHIFCSGLVNKCCSLLIAWWFVQYYGVYVGYIRSTVEHRHVMLQGHMQVIWMSVYQCFWSHYWLHWFHLKYI